MCTVKNYLYLGFQSKIPHLHQQKKVTNEILLFRCLHFTPSCTDIYWVKNNVKIKPHFRSNIMILLHGQCVISLLLLSSLVASSRSWEATDGRETGWAGKLARRPRLHTQRHHLSHSQGWGHLSSLNVF